MSFSHGYNILIEKLIKISSSAKGYSVYSEFDDGRYFRSFVEYITKQPVREYKGPLNESFPGLYAYNFVAQLNDKGLELRAGSNEWDKELGAIKAKGELLERLSTAAPLDIAIEKHFDTSFLVSLCDENVYAKRMLGFGKVKVSLGEIYYLLRRIQGGYARQVTTSGAAGHFDYDKAVLGALLELIQRDSFIVYWLNTIAPKKIKIDNSKLKEGSFLLKTIRDLEKYNLDYYFLDTTSDLGIPTCVCVLVSDSPTGKRIVLGSASGFNGEDILASAAMESLVVLNWNYFSEPLTLSDPYIPFSDARIGRDARLSIYLNDENFKKFEFFISSPEFITLENFTTCNNTLSGISLEDSKDQLLYLKKLFKQKFKENKEYDVLVYEVKNRLLDIFDYRVVRVICRALYPLYLNENLADPEHPRLQEFVKAKGLEKQAKINIWPHPFP
jgi:ribosomal protein S12 methylthiotransferase accessory factor